MPSKFCAFSNTATGIYAIKNAIGSDRVQRDFPMRKILRRRRGKTSVPLVWRGRRKRPRRSFYQRVLAHVVATHSVRRGEVFHPSTLQMPDAAFF